MNTRTPMLIALAGLGALTAAASAGVAVGSNEPLILSPCDDATVTVQWVADNAGLPGTLSWINPGIENTTVGLFDSEAVTLGDSVVLNRTYALGERVDFMYIAGGQNPEVFRTDVQADWGQFVVEQVDALTVLVHVEDIRLPGGDRDYNDAVFRVTFSHVPAPGSSMLFGAGLTLMGARRRR